MLLGLLRLTAQLRLAGQSVAGHRGVGGTAQIQQPVPDPRGLAVRALLFQGERQVVGGARGVAGVSGGQGAARGLPGGGQVPALVLHHGQPEQRPGLYRGPGVGRDRLLVELGGPLEVAVLGQVLGLCAQVVRLPGDGHLGVPCVVGIGGLGRGVGGARARGGSGRRGHSFRFPWGCRVRSAGSADRAA
ncbi:hypothetical protein GCM10009642_10600 [Nocardiopsis metallicus]